MANFNTETTVIVVTHRPDLFVCVQSAPLRYRIYGVVTGSSLINRFVSIHIYTFNIYDINLYTSQSAVHQQGHPRRNERTNDHILKPRHPTRTSNCDRNDDPPDPYDAISPAASGIGIVEDVVVVILCGCVCC